MADRQPLALATTVTPGYLAAMGLHLRGGRFFTDEDRFNTTPVVVIEFESVAGSWGPARSGSPTAPARATTASPAATSSTRRFIENLG